MINIRDGISVNFYRYPISDICIQPISDIRYFISVSPNRYPISDILPQPISDIRYFTDIPNVKFNILGYQYSNPKEKN